MPAPAAFTLVAVLLGQSGVVPNVEVTTGKQRALSESLAELESLHLILTEKLQLPPRPAPGQPMGPFYEAVERHYKAKAYFTGRLLRHYQSLLKQKYLLEAEVNQYRRYMAEMAERQEEFAKSVREYSERRRSEEKTLNGQVRVLAGVLADQLRTQAVTASPADAARLKTRADELEERANLTFLPGRDEIERGLDLPPSGDEPAARSAALQTLLADRLRQLKLVRYDRQLAEEEFGVSDEERGRLESLYVDLPLRQAIQQAEGILERPAVAELEFRADQLAIAAKHLGTRLEQLATDQAFSGEIAFRQKLAQFQNSMGVVERELDRAVGVGGADDLTDLGGGDLAGLLEILATAEDDPPADGSAADGSAENNAAAGDPGR